MGWIVAGAVLLAVVGLAALPLGVYVFYNGNPIVWLTIAFWKVRLFPPKEETDPRRRARREEKTRRRKSQREAKEAARKGRAEQKKQKDAARAEKRRKKGKKEIRKEVEEELHPKKLTPRRLLELAELGKDLLVTAVSDLCRHGRVKRLEVAVTAGGPDAAQAAILYGRVCAVLYPLDGILEASGKVAHKQISVSLDYGASEMSVLARAHYEIRVWRLMTLALRAIARYVTHNSAERDADTAQTVVDLSKGKKKKRKKAKKAGDEPRAKENAGQKSA